MLLVVEIGNTTTAFAAFSNGTCIEVLKTSTASLSSQAVGEELVVQFLSRHPEIRDTVFCSVVPAQDGPLVELMRRLICGRIMQVSSSLELPYTLRYNTPETFGPDRIALCAYSRMRYPEDAVIAIDLGTAITFDVLGSSGEYLGGLIVPGLDLMARVLHEHTARLPLVSIGEPVSITGFSTEACIRNGIVLSCAASLEGLAGKIGNWLREELGETSVKILATGGNAPLLAGMTGIALELDELAVMRGAGYLFELNNP